LNRQGAKHAKKPFMTLVFDRASANCRSVVFALRSERFGPLFDLSFLGVLGALAVKDSYGV
jgi:hypothetical protein